MPYIKVEDRYCLLKEGSPPQTAGELNFMFTRLAMDYLAIQGKNYSTLNTVVGALECAKQGFYRRVIVPYENIKLEENGDVYHV